MSNAKAEVIIITDPETTAGQPTRMRLYQYLEKTVMEKTDPHFGVIEQLEENVQYLAGIVGRMLEAQIIGECDFGNARKLDAILFGEDTNHLREVVVTLTKEQP